MSRRVITGETFTEEKPLFAARETDVIDCVFDKGESPLKEVSDIKVKGGGPKVFNNAHWRKEYDKNKRQHKRRLYTYDSEGKRGSD